MATFNPGVPQINPQEYLNYSRPISDIQADKSTGELISGVGSILGEGIKASDALTKDKIQADMYAKIDPVRQQFNTSLTDYRQQLLDKGATFASNGSIYDDPNAIPENASPVEYLKNPPLDVIPKNNAPDVPGVKQGLAQASDIVNAKRNNQGNISMSWYDAQLDSVASDMRSKYPMYRAYIDQQMQSITGMDPANSVIRSNILDINRLVNSTATNQQNEMNYLRTNLNNYGSAGTQIWQQLQSDPSADNKQRAYNFIGRNKDIDLKASRTSAAIANIKGTEDLDHSDAVREATSYASSVVANKLYNLDAASNTTGIPVIRQFIQNVTDGTFKDFNSSQGIVYANQMDQYKQQTAEELRTWYHTPDKSTHIAPDQRIPQDTFENQMLPAALKPLQDIRDRLYKGDITTAMLHSQFAQSAASDDKWRAGRGDYGTATAMLDRLHNLYGDQFMVSQGAAALYPDLAKEQQDWFADQKMKADTQYKPAFNNQQSYNMFNSLTYSQNMSSNYPGEKTGALNKHITDIPLSVLNKNVPDGVKENNAIYGFSNDSYKALDLIPDGGKVVGNKTLGRYDVINSFTSKEYATEIARLDKTDPKAGLADMYKNWYSTVASKYFDTTIKDLNNMNDQGSLNFHLYKSDADGLMHVDFKEPMKYGSKSIPVPQGLVNTVNAKVNAINVLLSGSRNITQALYPGVNPNGFADQLLARSGLSNIDKSSKRLTSPEDQVMHYSDDNNSGMSVTDFVNNPTGMKPEFGKSPAGPAPSYAGTGVIKGNLKDMNITGYDTHFVPAGMDPLEFFKQMQQGKLKQGQADKNE